MCLVLIALESVPGHRLVLAANRDEWHARPAEALHWWPDRPELAGGRDAVAGGTWLAVRRDGHFATVLNAPGAAAPQAAPSRGDLVPGFLAAEDSAAAVRRIRDESSRYAGFHFVAGSAGRGTTRGWYVGHRQARVTALDHGVHGIDSAGLDTADPRLGRALAGFGRAAAAGPASLLDLLGDDTDPGPGADDSRPVFIRGPEFGTRCSTVLLIADDGRCEIRERRFAANGVVQEETRLHWCIEATAAGPR